jgi:hypothetical protein
MTSTRVRVRRAEIETAQRSALRAFAEAIGVKATLSQDEYGNWALRGSKARVYAIEKGAICGFAGVRAQGPGFLFLRSRQSGRGWMAAKPLHAFCHVYGGVEAGVLFIDHMPTAEEAEAVARVIGLPRNKLATRDPSSGARSRSVATRADCKDFVPARSLAMVASHAAHIRSLARRRDDASPSSSARPADRRS